MLSFKNRRLWFTQPTVEGTTPFNADKVLLGLSPRLVIDLARLAGASLDDLEVTFQLMPWGDRATLAAYKVVTLDEESDKPGRGLRVHPVALELVSAAAEVTALAAEPSAVAQILLERERYLDPFVGSRNETEPVPVAVTSLIEQQKSGAKLVQGIVQDIDVQHGKKMVAVEVDADALADLESERQGQRELVVVSPTKEFTVHRSTPVVLSYDETSNDARPITISEVRRSKD